MTRVRPGDPTNSKWLLSDGINNLEIPVSIISYSVLLWNSKEQGNEHVLVIFSNIVSVSFLTFGYFTMFSIISSYVFILQNNYFDLIWIVVRTIYPSQGGMSTPTPRDTMF